MYDLLRLCPGLCGQDIRAMIDRLRPWGVEMVHGDLCTLWKVDPERIKEEWLKYDRSKASLSVYPAKPKKV